MAVGLILQCLFQMVRRCAKSRVKMPDISRPFALPPGIVRPSSWQELPPSRRWYLARFTASVAGLVKHVLVEGSELAISPHHLARLVMTALLAETCEHSAPCVCASRFRTSLRPSLPIVSFEALAEDLGRVWTPWQVRRSSRTRSLYPGPLLNESLRNECILRHQREGRHSPSRSKKLPRASTRRIKTVSTKSMAPISP